MKDSDLVRLKTRHQERVEEFMRKAGQTVPDRPTMPDEDARQLRARLILEEALETVRALGFVAVVDDRVDLTEKKEFEAHVDLIEHDGKPTLAEVADGCADIIVVTTGTLSACGIADDPVQREVDANNLAKFDHRCPKCGRPGIGDDSVPGQRVCHPCGEMWVSGYRRPDGKWVKPPAHKPPRIAEVIAAQTRAVEEQAKATKEA